MDIFLDILLKPPQPFIGLFFEIKFKFEFKIVKKYFWAARL